MNKFFKSIVRIGLAASLLLHSCPELEASDFIPSPLAKTAHYFQRNQEIVRLGMEALNLQSIGSKPLLDSLSKFPYASRLLVRYSGSSLALPESRLRSALAIPYRIGRHGFELFHEWSHLVAAFVRSPLSWRSIFTRANLSGHRSLQDWREGVVKGKSWPAPYVELPFESDWVRKGGWAMSLIPVAPIIYTLSVMDPQNVVASPILLTLGVTVLSGMLVSLVRSISSDWIHAPQPMVYACGVDGTDQTLAPTERKVPYASKPIPPETAKLSLAQGEVTVMRGMHEGGAAIRIAYRKAGRLHYRILTVKVVSLKRDYLPELLEAEIQAAVSWERLKSIGIEYPERFIVLKHFRYSTSSDPTIQAEAHPHYGEATRQAVMYRYENGQRVKVTEEVTIANTHNGDFDGLRWFDGRMLTEGEFKALVAPFLVDPGHPDRLNPNVALHGDSPTGAMLVSLLRTQFDAYASLRLGMLKVFSHEPRYHVNLKPQRINQLKEVFERVIDHELNPTLNLAELSPDEIAALKQRIVAAFQYEAQREAEFWQDMPGSFIEPVIAASLEAFLENDLFRSMQLFSEFSYPSFGMGVLSTVDEDPIFFAKQQPFSLARNQTNKKRGWNSEQRSLTIETENEGEWAYEERFDLRPYRGGEVVRMHEDGNVDVYDVAHKQLIDPAVVEERWFNMAQSPFTALTRRHRKDKAKSLADLDDASHYLKGADEIWSNPRSFNRQIVSNNISRQFLRLAEMQRKGKLPPGAHVAFVGFWTDMAQAYNMIDTWKEYMPGLSGLHIELVPANQVLEDPEIARKKYGLGQETLVFVLDYFGQQFPTINAATYLMHYCPNVVGITGGLEGDVDNPLAVAMGQDLHAGSPLRGNVITTGSPWPSTQAMPYCHANMMATLNYLFLQVAEDLLDASQRSKTKPFGLELKQDEIEEMRAYQRAIAHEVGLLTGTNVDSTSDTRQDLLRQASRLQHEFSEPRAVRYLYRTFPLFGVLFVMNYYGWAGPHSLIPVPDIMSPFWLALTNALLDSAFFSAIGLVILLGLRVAQKRQLFSRQGTRVVGISHPEAYLLAEHDWKMYFGLSRPDATAIVIGGDSVGSLNNEFLKRVKPLLSRSSWMINVQTDNDLPSLVQRSGAIKMSATQVKVERSMPMARLFLFLNKILWRFGNRRIPFASTQVITIGRAWQANANAEDVLIQMPTVFFPLPRPWDKFMSDVEANIRLTEGFADFRLTAIHRRLFAREMNRMAGEPASHDAIAVGIAMAEKMGLPRETFVTFAKAFLAADGALFELTAEEKARRQRIERWVGKRIYPIGDLIALDVLGEEAARKTNTSLFMHRQAPTGYTQSAAVIDTTATGVSAARVAEHAHEPIVLRETSIQLTDRTQVLLEQKSAGPRDVHELFIQHPYPLRLGHAVPSGMQLVDTSIQLHTRQSPLRLWHDLRAIGEYPQLRITFQTTRGSVPILVPLSELPAERWNTISIDPSAIPEDIAALPVTHCQIVVEGAEGTLRVDRSVAPVATPWSVFAPVQAAPVPREVAVAVPTATTASKAGSAHIRDWLGRAALIFIAFVTLSTTADRVERPGPTSEGAQGSSESVPAPVSAPRLSPTPVVSPLAHVVFRSNETVTDAQRRRLSPERLQELAGEGFESFVRRIVKEHPETAAYLSRPGSALKLWVEVIGPQLPGETVNIYDIRPGKGFDLTSLVPKKALAPVKPQAKTESQPWHRGLFSKFISFLGVAMIALSWIPRVQAATVPAAGAVQDVIQEAAGTHGLLPSLAEQGDTVSELAQAAGMSVAEYMRLHPDIQDANWIYAGKDVLLKTFDAPAVPDLGSMVSWPSVSAPIEVSSVVMPFPWMDVVPYALIVGLMLFAAAVIFYGTRTLLSRQSSRTPAHLMLATQVLALFLSALPGFASSPRAGQVGAKPRNELTETLLEHEQAIDDFKDLTEASRKSGANDEVQVKIREALKRKEQAEMNLTSLKDAPSPANAAILGPEESAIILQQHLIPLIPELATIMSEIDGVLRRSVKVGKDVLTEKIKPFHAARATLLDEWNAKLLELNREQSKFKDAEANGQPETPESILARNDLKTQVTRLRIELRMIGFSAVALDGVSEENALELASAQVDLIFGKAVERLTALADRMAAQPDRKNRKDELAFAVAEIRKQPLVAVASVEPTPMASVPPPTIPSAEPVEAVLPKEAKTSSYSPKVTRVAKALTDLETSRADRETARAATDTGAKLKDVIANYRLSDLSVLKGNTFDAVMKGEIREKPANPLKVVFGGWLFNAPNPHPKVVTPVLKDGALLYAEQVLLSVLEELKTAEVWQEQVREASQTAEQRVSEYRAEDAGLADAKDKSQRLAEELAKASERAQAAQAQWSAFDAFLKEPGSQEPASLRVLRHHLKGVRSDPNSAHMSLGDRIQAHVESYAKVTRGKYPTPLVAFASLEVNTSDAAQPNLTEMLPARAPLYPINFSALSRQMLHVIPGAPTVKEVHKRTPKRPARAEVRPQQPKKEFPQIRKPAIPQVRPKTEFPRIQKPAGARPRTVFPTLKIPMSPRVIYAGSIGMTLEPGSLLYWIGLGLAVMALVQLVFTVWQVLRPQRTTTSLRRARLIFGAA
jgi:hypothetical protein